MERYLKGGEHLLTEIFYEGNRKWLNALQFLQAEKRVRISVAGT